MVSGRLAIRRRSAATSETMCSLTRRNRGDSCAGHNFHCGNNLLFCDGYPLSSRLRKHEIGRGPEMLGNVVLIVICVLLLGYLLVYLLKHEKFLHVGKCQVHIPSCASTDYTVHQAIINLHVSAHHT